ncbi:Protein BREAST CANCER SUSCEPTIBILITY 1 homolog [Linum perenne]
MADPIHLEKMGRELKCPICLSLLNSAVSLSCNHVFCESCISLSMKSHWDCPVCKVPYRRREVRPAPHMDNLVSIYRSMEIASGFNIFVTQATPAAKSPDKAKQVGLEDIVENRKPRRSMGSKKGIRKTQEESAPTTSKPSFPTKKRVQVPQYPLSETPLRGAKGNQVVSSGNPVTSEDGELVLSPLFWLRDDDAERLSETDDDDDSLSLTPLSIPSFSDIKGSSKTESARLSPTGEYFNGNSHFVDDSDCELVGCTQKPSSVETFSTPFEMLDQGTDKLNQIHQGASSVSLIGAVTWEVPNDASCPRDENAEIVHEDPKRRLRHAGGEILRRCPEMNDGTSSIKLSAATVQSGKLCRRKASGRKSISLNLEGSEKANLGTSADESEYQNSSVIAEEAVSLADDEMADGWATTFNKSYGSVDHRQPKKTRKLRRKKIVSNSDFSMPFKKQKLDSEEIDMSDEVDEKSNNLNKKKQHRVSFSTVHQIGETSTKLGKRLVNGEKIINMSARQTQCTEDSSGAGASMNLADKERMNKLAASFIDNQHGHDEMKRSGKERRAETCKTDCPVSSKNSIEIKMATKDSTAKKRTDETKQTQLPFPEVTATGRRSASDTNKETGIYGASETQCTKLVEGSCRGGDIKINIIKCAFCHSPKVSEASGEMIHYYNGRPVAADYVGQSKVLHCHKSCAEWAPNVYFEDDVAVNLEAELARSRRIKCSCCELKGAALGCYEKTCRKSFHVPCAKMIPECRWDNENFVILCPIHSSAKLPNEKRGSQSRNTDTCRERQNTNKCESVIDRGFSRSHSSDSCFISHKLVLCCSALTDAERELVGECERKFGAKVMKKWDPSVTHVIASVDTNGACKRTLKTLMGILWGKWILNINWIKDCVRAQKFIEEEPYEINVDIHGIKDGPRFGRLRVQNKQPKILEGFKCYFMGDFIPSYKGYLQALITVAGGSILHRKPIKEVSGTSVSPSTLIIYNSELLEKEDQRKMDTILSHRQSDAKEMADSTGAKAVSNLWVLNSIAACQLQSFPV